MRRHNPEKTRPIPKRILDVTEQGLFASALEREPLHVTSVQAVGAVLVPRRTAAQDAFTPLPQSMLFSRLVVDGLRPLQGGALLQPLDIGREFR